MGPERTPIEIIYSDILDVMSTGEPPKTSKEELLRLLSLDCAEPDGKTLGQRLITEDMDLMTVMQLRACISDVGHLLTTLNDPHYPTPYAHRRAMAENLMAVAAAQIRREGPACQIVTSLTLQAMTVDHTLVPAETMVAVLDQMTGGLGSGFETRRPEPRFTIRRMPGSLPPFRFRGE
jgi:hypothetical protein